MSSSGRAGSVDGEVGIGRLVRQVVDVAERVERVNGVAEVDQEVLETMRRPPGGRCCHVEERRGPSKRHGPEAWVAGALSHHHWVSDPD